MARYLAMSQAFPFIQSGAFSRTISSCLAYNKEIYQLILRTYPKRWPKNWMLKMPKRAILMRKPISKEV